MPRRKRDAKSDWKKEMEKEEKSSYKYNRYNCNHHHHAVLGGFWLAGWLFTIGVLKLAFWKAVLAIFIWAYYLGSYLATVWH